MRRLILAFVLLAGCAPEPEVTPVVAGHRDHSVPISSTTRGAPADIEGRWVVSRALIDGQFVSPGSEVQIAAAEGGLWRWSIPQNGAVVTFLTEVTLPGRYRMVSASGARGAIGAPEIWLLWVDDDFRTAVIGTPDGTAGWIMDRPGQASGDRTRAAREILDFNGYATPDFIGGEG